MHKRRRIRRSGISTVVGNMLMILITLSLAAILVAWAGTSYGSFTGGAQVYYAQRQQALQERFAVELVFFNKTAPSNHTLMVFVRNVGLQPITIAAIYVNGTSIQNSMLASKTGLCQIGTIMSIGAVCEFFITGYTPTGSAIACTGLQAQQWCSGVLFNFVVATARGNQDTYSARGP